GAARVASRGRPGTRIVVLSDRRGTWYPTVRRAIEHRVEDRVTGMRVLFVHPSPLIFSEIYLRLEPLGLEMVVAAARAAGHDVRLGGLQVWRPQESRDRME